MNASSGTDKVKFDSSADLVSHRYDYRKENYKEKELKRRKDRVKVIKKMPQPEQKTKEWFDMRKKCITATKISTALDEDPYEYPIDLLLDKTGRGVPFISNVNTHHGCKYEQIGDMYYAFRNNVKVDEYGLLIHDKHRFVGASPDGICNWKTKDGNHLSKLVGRLLEIKFPKTRQILVEGKLNGEIVPHYYYIQCQTQLFVTNMDECDFLQCKIYEYADWDEFSKIANLI